MDHQEETGLPLDGNAAARLLRELFVFDVTAAEVTCGSCGERVLAPSGVLLPLLEARPIRGPAKLNTRRATEWTSTKA